MLQAGSFHLSWEGNSLYLKGTAPGRDWAPGFSAATLPSRWAGIWGLPYGFPSALALPARSLPAPDTLEHRASRSSWERAARAGRELVWTAQDGEGWGGCGEPGPSPLPSGFFGQRLAVPKPPREGKSWLSSPQTQRPLQKKQEVKWARGRNTGQPQSGTGLQTA